MPATTAPPAVTAPAAPVAANPKRSTSLAPNPLYRLEENQSMPAIGRSSSRARRALPIPPHPSFPYETPDEEDELLDEALHGVQGYVKKMDAGRRGAAESPHPKLASKDASRQPPPQQPLHHAASAGAMSNPYPTPSPSAKRNGMLFTNTLLDEPATPMNIVGNRHPDSAVTPTWPTPPYDENEWGASAAASIYAAGSVYR